MWRSRLKLKTSLVEFFVTVETALNFESVTKFNYSEKREVEINRLKRIFGAT